MKDSARIAVGHYYYRLSHAFFRSFELEVYAGARIHLKHPILDLGCGEGHFGMMLQQRGILDSIDVGLDYSFDDISEAKQNSPTASFIQGDLRTLPLKGNSIGSLFSNGVVCCMRTNNEADVDQALSEIQRVLVDDGLLVLTVATTQFNHNLIIPKILWKIGAAKLARQSMHRIALGLSHYQALAEEAWLRKLHDAHFNIEQVRYYFTPYQALWWNMFTLPPFSFWFKRLKNPLLRPIQPITACLLARFFSMILMAQNPLDPNPSRAGYLLILARKIPMASAAPARQGAVQ
jgi:ubiquinone/menaquinone biosynthesis C-methylase UbiE